MKDVITQVFLITILACWSVQVAASTLSERDVRNVISLMGDSEKFEEDVERLVPGLAERRHRREEDLRLKMIQATMTGDGDPTEMLMVGLETSMNEDMDLIRQHPEANTMVTDFVRKHGFSDKDVWIEITLRVINAHMAVQTERPNPEMDAVWDQLESLPGMQKERIQEIKAQFLQMQEAQKRYFSDVPQEDKNVVARFIDELNNVMVIYEDPDYH